MLIVYVDEKNRRRNRLNFIANVQNICYLIGQEEYYIDRTVLSVSILKSATFDFCGAKH